MSSLRKGLPDTGDPIRHDVCMVKSELLHLIVKYVKTYSRQSSPGSPPP
jgi:hypothetical protein